MELDLVIQAVMLPALAAACVHAVIVALSWRAPAPVRAVAAAAIAVLAVLPAFRALAVQEGGILASGLRSSVSYGWLPAASLVASLVAAAVCAGGGRASVRAAAAAAPLAAMSLLSPPGFRGGGWQLAAAASVAFAAMTVAGGTPVRGRERFVLWWLLLAVASGFLLLSGFAKLAFVVASMSATAAAMGVASLVVRAVRPTAAMDIAFATALGGAAFLGMAYDEAPLPRACWVALAAAPAVAAASSLPAVRARPRLAAAAIAVLPAAAAAAALAAAFALQSPAAARDDAYAAARGVRLAP
jgi:hypothetical protein